MKAPRLADNVQLHFSNKMLRLGQWKTAWELLALMTKTKAGLCCRTQLVVGSFKVCWLWECQKSDPAVDRCTVVTKELVLVRGKPCVTVKSEILKEGIEQIRNLSLYIRASKDFSQRNLH